MEKLTRCFIALELSRETREYIEETQELVKKKNLFAGKFTEPENLHLTLKFLGEVGENKIEEIKNKLSEIKFNEFEASLGEVGVFINTFNSILWIKLNGKEIWDLQKIIDEKLKDLFPKEERFMSHITIARIKKMPKAFSVSQNLHENCKMSTSDFKMKKIHGKTEFLEYVKNIKVKKVKFTVRDFVLKKSELKEEGPVYTDMGKYSLES